jgi:hypothetical protein
MASINSSFYRDANFAPIWTDGLVAKKTLTFTGGTADTLGDHDGTADPNTIFTVTGLVKARVVAVCTTDLTGASSTYEIGISGDTAIFCSLTTCTTIDKDEIWLGDTTPASYFIIGEEEAAADNYPLYLLYGTDIIGTAKTANIEAGVLDVYCIWVPISSDASVVAA